MKLEDLTTQDLVDIYNENFNSYFSNEQLIIEISAYGVIEIHEADTYDDMVLTISSNGSLYLYCLDNGEIYHDVLGALNYLKRMKVEPFGN